jgi:hypothetical protein
VGPRYWIQTDLAGTIIDLSADAAVLLRIGLRAARGLPLPPFFGRDRDQILRDMRAAHRDGRPVTTDRFVRGRATKGAWFRVQIQRAREADEVVWILWP